MHLLLGRHLYVHATHLNPKHRLCAGRLVSLYAQPHPPWSAPVACGFPFNEAHRGLHAVQALSLCAGGMVPPGRQSGPPTSLQAHSWDLRWTAAALPTLQQGTCHWDTKAASCGTPVQLPLAGSLLDSRVCRLAGPTGVIWPSMPTASCTMLTKTMALVCG